MKTRILTAILIILCVLPPVFFGGWLLELLGVFIIASGTYEALHSMPFFKKHGIPVWIALMLWVLVLYFIPQTYLLAWWIAGLIVFWSMPVFFAWITSSQTMTILAWMTIFGLSWMSMQLLIPVHQYLWTLCFATYGSDTGAYFSGRFLGRHKMNERISPKKTWEGFFGGWLCGFALSFLISFLYASQVDFKLNFVICLLAPVTAELGDLCFSAYKRANGLKDFSDLLPGHGGILDRVDSLMMNFLLFGFLITLMPLIGI